ncbi:MAG: hypothetical protein ABJE10_14685 [bacterium]
MVGVGAALLLMLATTGWFLLAMLPALHEHFARKDVSPLRVASAAADVRYFGLSFQAFVTKQLASLRERARTPLPHVTTLADESPAWYAPHPEDASSVTEIFARASADEVETGLVVMAEGGLRAGNGVQVLKELYTGGSLTAGANCIFRAVLAQDDATLGANCEVLRWVNTGGKFSAGRGTALWGRASSWGTMSLSEGVSFQRIAAPRIEMGSPVRDIPKDMSSRPEMKATKNVSIIASRWLVSGDFTVPAGESVSTDLIVSGTLHVGNGALLHGAVRCDVLVAGNDCVFTRSVIGAKRLTFGARCHVTGPIVVEGEATFGDDSRIGDSDAGTTISAVTVRMGNGVVACGEVWVRQQGMVLAVRPEITTASSAA